MSANNTPQAYLAQFRQNTTASKYQDPSMAQDNTNSGNPSGYYDPGSQAPPNRYIPPSFNPLTGQWDQQGQTYSLPTGYTPNGGGGMPTGPTPMPNLYGGSQGGQQGTAQAGGGMPQPQQAAAGGPPLPNFVGAGSGVGNPQNPNDTYMSHPRPGMPQANSVAQTDPQAAYGLQQAQSDFNNSLTAAQGNAVSGNGVMPASAQPGNNPGAGMAAMNAAFNGGMPQFATPPVQRQPGPPGHMGVHPMRSGYNMPNRYNPNIRNY